MEDIAFWILISLVVGIAIWKLIGSPTDTAALISISLFIGGSELVLWKHLFAMDKRVSIGFFKMKNDFNNLNKDFNYRFDNIEKDFNNRLSSIDNKLNDIKNIIKKK